MHPLFESKRGREESKWISEGKDECGRRGEGEKGWGEEKRGRRREN
jgi:hypothetical protein